jgi:hypothetical protein
VFARARVDHRFARQCPNFKRPGQISPTPVVAPMPVPQEVVGFSVAQDHSRNGSHPAARLAKKTKSVGTRKSVNKTLRPHVSIRPHVQLCVASLLLYRPPSPILSAEPPKSDGWIHEIKHDGFRTLLRMTEAASPDLRWSRLERQMRPGDRCPRNRLVMFAFDLLVLG